jgi:signal transduction histidine kinase/DNA-binding NarL/FixJ family response regulator
MSSEKEKTRVLVVEDENIIASDIVHSLEQMEYIVVAIEVSGHDAVRAAHELKPDIVLMDIVLQDEIDGIEAASQIRSLNIPVIFLTAYAEEKVLERAKLTDAFGYLIKPFESNELHFTIQMALYKSKAEEELKRVTRAMKTLSSCNQALIVATDESELLSEICGIITGVGGYSLAWVSVPEEKGGSTLRIVASEGMDKAHLEKLNLSLEDSANILVTSLKKSMPISIQDLSIQTNDQWSAEMAASGYASCIALPLTLEEKSLGILCICASEPNAFDPDEFDLLVDLANNLSYWIMSVRNRISHRLAEEALEASHERFIAVMDSIEAIVYVADMNTHGLLFVNKYVRDNFGQETGKRCWQLFQSEKQEDPCSFCTNKYLLDSGGRPTGVYHWEHKNPLNNKWYDIRDRAIRWVDGRMVRLQIATDITDRMMVEEELERHRERLTELVDERTAELKTANIKLQQEIVERKRAEEELLKAQKLESLGILAGGIAHDFNNILTSILNNISLARMYSSQQNDQYSKLVAAEKATLRARDLTQHLLTFSKSGVPVKKTASIVELLKDSAEFALMGSNVKTKYRISPNTWSVDVDEAQISQVISNLVINAGQAMPGGGTIWMNVENKDIRKREVPQLKAGRYVVMSFKDEGIGIPQKYLNNIFDPYFTTKKGGSGLGLASTYSIIKNHEGHISVESELGMGTTFVVYLPASTEHAPKGRDTVEEVLRGKGRILVMDDDPNVRESVAEVLNFLGYNAHFAEDGEEAIKIYSNAAENDGNFEAVIMDLTIPGGMGGIEALSRLREIDPSVKAIVSSGYSNDPVMSNYRRYGFSGVINKPYRVEDLSKVLDSVINNKPV